MTNKNINDILLEIINNNPRIISNFFDYKEEFEQESENIRITSDYIFKKFVYTEAKEDNNNEEIHTIRMKVSPLEPNAEVTNPKFHLFVNGEKSLTPELDSVIDFKMDSVLQIFQSGSPKYDKFLLTPENNEDINKYNFLSLSDEQSEKSLEKSNNGFIVNDQENFKIVNKETTEVSAAIGLPELPTAPSKIWIAALKNTDTLEKTFKEISAQFLIREILYASYDLFIENKRKDKKSIVIEEKEFNNVYEKFKSNSKNIIIEYLNAVKNEKDALPNKVQYEKISDAFNKFITANINNIRTYLNKTENIVTKNIFKNSFNLCNKAGIADRLRTNKIDVLSFFGKFMNAANIHFDETLYEYIKETDLTRKGLIDIKDVFSNKDLIKFWKGKFYKEIIAPNSIKFDSLIEHLGQPLNQKQTTELESKLNSNKPMEKVSSPLIKNNDANTNAIRNELTMYSFIALALGFLDRFGKLARTQKEFNESEIIKISDTTEIEYLEGIISGALSSILNTSKDIFSKLGRFTFKDFASSSEKFINSLNQIMSQNEQLVNQVVKDMDLYNYDDVILDQFIHNVNDTGSTIMKQAISDTNAQIVPQIMNQLPKYFKNDDPGAKTFAGKTIRKVGDSLLKAKKGIDSAKPGVTQATNIVGEKVTNVNNKETDNV